MIKLGYMACCTVVRTNKHKLRSPMAWQGGKKRSSQRQVQHAGLVDEHGIALQGVISVMLECAKHVVRTAIALATCRRVPGASAPQSAHMTDKDTLPSHPGNMQQYSRRRR